MSLKFKRTTTANPKLSAPWYTVHRELIKLFKYDPEIKVSPLNDDTKEVGGVYTVYISSDNKEKLSALEKLIKTEYTFGNIKMYIKLISNGQNEDTLQLVKTAFAGNQAVAGIESVADWYDLYTFMIFEDKVVQFYDDDIEDLFGNWNGLYTDVAKDLFKDNPYLRFTIKRVK